MTNLYDAMDFCDSILIFIAFHVLWSPQCICICNSDAIHFSENISGVGKKYNAAEILQNSCVLSEFSIFPNGSTGLSLLLQILLTIGISLEL